MNTDTIAAIATAPGRGGVGIIRISGPKCRDLADKILKTSLKPRFAQYCDFFDIEGKVVDKGLALFFENPHSFTGEDVLELQGHGGPIVLDLLMETLLSLGVRQARPGEFSERAFLNDKMDLAQAEAIADLIDASSRQAARSALNSLSGVFSTKVQALVESLINLRLYVESAIDFPEEEIDFLSDGHVASKLHSLIDETSALLKQANQGVLLKEGMKVAIVGKPNAGKSSLLNALAEKDVAIVTDIAGTTRDMLREHIQIDGMPLHIIDTAGLRDEADIVEQIGIERARKAMEEADRILLLVDFAVEGKQHLDTYWSDLGGDSTLKNKVTLIYNKIDKNRVSSSINTENNEEIYISAQTGEGLNQLKTHLKAVMGLQNTVEGQFSARRRHIQAIETALQSIRHGERALKEHAAGELLAEDLRMAQNSLNEITGEFSADDLLGRIFSSFCIGK